MILKGIKNTQLLALKPQHLFGEGKSDEKFLEIISQKYFWQTPKQKVFKDF